jgi:hypothetical protein
MVWKHKYNNILVFLQKYIPKHKDEISFSYGKFILNNPDSTKEERRKAVKKFLDYTR